jgi:hypothetical protein
MAELDPWSQLVATTPGPAPRHLAYADGESVGFDVRMPLPRQCLVCGGDRELAVSRRRLRIERDLLTSLGHHLHGQRVDGLVRIGDRIELALSFCVECRARHAQTRRAEWVVRLTPAWFLTVVVGAMLLLPSATGYVLFAALAAFGAAFYRREHLRARTMVVIESIDGDGIVRISPVHPDTAQAILVAAGMQAPAS